MAKYKLALGILLTGIAIGYAVLYSSETRVAERVDWPQGLPLPEPSAPPHPNEPPLPEEMDSDTLEGWRASANRTFRCNYGTIQLAHEGAKVFPLLEKWRTDQTLSNEAATRILNLAFLESTKFEEAEKFPNLREIVKRELENLEVAKSFMLYDRNPGIYAHVKPPDWSLWATPHPGKAALEAMNNAGGFGVIMAFQLFKSGYPAGLLNGARYLTYYDPVPYYEDFVKFKNIDHEFVDYGDDYIGTSNVGAIFERALKNIEPRLKTPSPFLVAERYLLRTCVYPSPPSIKSCPDMLNIFRREGKTMEAKTWRDYWTRAKPLFWREHRKCRYY
ncbi:MAG: hypothetical protein ABL958_20095 [Bdellovibrionia bacterium]